MYLAKIRQAFGKSQRDLANIIHVQHNTVCRWEMKDSGQLRVRDLRDYAKALGLELRITMVGDGKEFVVYGEEQ